MAGKFISWGFTLNNYTEQELVSIRSVPEFIRECVYELEKGEDEGTPHVQGFFRLKTQQRMSFLQKHFLARAHYTGLSSEEYKQNMKVYAQKQDATATSAVHQQNQQGPILFPAVIPEMIVEILLREGYRQTDLDSQRWEHQGNLVSFEDMYDRGARELVSEHRVETMVVRPDVKSCVRLYWHPIMLRLNKRNANDTPSIGSREAEELQSDCGTDDYSSEASS